MLAQPTGHRDQEPVSGAMAQAVIDFLELVQVQHEQGVAPDGQIPQSLLPFGIQGPAICQPGQLVGGGA